MVDFYGRKNILIMANFIRHFLMHECVIQADINLFNE